MALRRAVLVRCSLSAPPTPRAVPAPLAVTSARRPSPGNPGGSGVVRVMDHANDCDGPAVSRTASQGDAHHRLESRPPRWLDSVRSRMRPDARPNR